MEVLLVYQILFGLEHVNNNAFFTLRNLPHLRRYS